MSPTPENTNGSVTPSGNNTLSASLGNDGSAGRSSAAGSTGGAASMDDLQNSGTTATGATTGHTPGATRAHLGQAGSHLKQAARDAGSTLKGAATAAGEELRIGGKQVKADLADGALEGITAAEQAALAAREQMDQLMEKGCDLMDTAAEMIRQRPLAAFGVAFAAGWLIAKLARGGSDR